MGWAFTQSKGAVGPHPSIVISYIDTIIVSWCLQFLKEVGGDSLQPWAIIKATQYEVCCVHRWSWVRKIQKESQASCMWNMYPQLYSWQRWVDQESSHVLLCSNTLIADWAHCSVRIATTWQHWTAGTGWRQDYVSMHWCQAGVPVCTLGSKLIRIIKQEENPRHLIYWLIRHAYACR